MSAILKSLELVDAHKDVVALYYASAAGLFVVAGVQKTNGGAVVTDAKGRELGFYPTKLEALAPISA